MSRDPKTPEDAHAEDAFGALEREFKRFWTTLDQPRAEAEAQITKNPWATVGLVGLVALFIGYLLGRGGRR